MNKAPWIAAVVTAGYFLFTAGVFWLFNVGVPRAVEQVLSMLVTPAVLLLGVWSPVLKRLGWSRGEWFSVPSLPGFVVLVVFYALVAFALTAALWRLFHR